jgi:hypothetical protein
MNRLHVIHSGKQIKRHRPRLRSSIKLQVRAPLKQAPNPPRTPHATSSERCRPERVTEKTRSAPVSRLAAPGAGTQNVYRASRPPVRPLLFGRNRLPRPAPLHELSPARSRRRLAHHDPRHFTGLHLGGMPSGPQHSAATRATSRARSPRTWRCARRNTGGLCRSHWTSCAARARGDGPFYISPPRPARSVPRSDQQTKHTRLAATPRLGGRCEGDWEPRASGGCAGVATLVSCLSRQGEAKACSGGGG